MAQANTSQKHRPIQPSQQRGRERYEFLLDCAEQLLANLDKDEEISIHKMAEQAQLPAASVYRLFPSIQAVHFALAQRYLKHLSQTLEKIDFNQCQHWQEALALSITEGAAFYNSHPFAMELIFNSNISSDIRNADRDNAASLAGNAKAWLSHWHLEEAMLPLQIELMLNLLDTVWAQSYHAHDHINPFFLEESIRVATAYLELYLPKYQN